MLIVADSNPVRQLVVAAADDGFRWIDVAAPNRATLSALTEELHLPESAAEDCLDPHQLPKVERHGELTFIVVRLHVGPVGGTSASARELTTPLAILVGPDLILTIHRRDHAVLARLRRAYAAAEGEVTVADVLDELIGECILTFDGPLNELTEDLTAFEASLFSAQVSERTLEQIFVRKRRASVLGWILLRTREALVRSHGATDRFAPLYESRETLDALQFRARELVEHTENLLNLQIALASHRTNEVMRVLTVMSVIFMPLTFVAGVYGMNFDAPEFHWRYGYFGVWVLLGAVFLGALAWFRARGWMR
jgi:magnesium transporter